MLSPNAYQLFHPIGGCGAGGMGSTTGAICCVQLRSRVGKIKPRQAVSNRGMAVEQGGSRNCSWTRVIQSSLPVLRPGNCGCCEFVRSAVPVTSLTLEETKESDLRRRHQADASTSHSSTSTATERISRSMESTRRNLSLRRTRIPVAPAMGPLLTRTRRPTRR